MLVAGCSKSIQSWLLCGSAANATFGQPTSAKRGERQTGKRPRAAAAAIRGHEAANMSSPRALPSRCLLVVALAEQSSRCRNFDLSHFQPKHSRSWITQDDSVVLSALLDANSIPSCGQAAGFHVEAAVTIRASRMAAVNELHNTEPHIMKASCKPCTFLSCAPRYACLLRKASQAMLDISGFAAPSARVVH